MKQCVQCGITHANKFSGPFCCSLCESKFHSTSNRETQRAPCSHCAQLMELRHDQTRASPMVEAMWFRVLFFIDLENAEGQDTLLNLRLVSKSFKNIAQVFASRITPIVSMPQFITAYGEDFSDFKKDTKGAKTVTRERSAKDSYLLYLNVVGKVMQTRERTGPAYIEIFAEKKALFKINNSAWKDGRLFNPKGAWTPEINDSWVLANIHSKQSFRLMAQISHLGNFWDDEFNRPTALGRELIQLWRSGYRPAIGDFAADPYRGFGILLYPGRSDVQNPVSLSDARNGSLDELKEIMGDIAQSISPTASVTMPLQLTGIRPSGRLDADTGKQINK